MNAAVTRRPILAFAILACTAAAASAISPPEEQQADAPGTRPTVLRGELRGPITPVTLEYVQGLIAESSPARHALIVFEMNTPGGLAASTEEIIGAILGSAVPVAVFVSPAGAQAASAGLYITNAADVAAMTPGTRIGAGHPVSITGGNPGGEEEGEGRDYMGEKVENDMAAGVRSIATVRGRNAEIYERMVRESISLTEREALEERVIDLVAQDLDDLIEKLDGREVTRFNGARSTLALAGAVVERFEMTTWQRVLTMIADPRISFILLGVGMLGLYMEFSNPGLILPGVLGGLSLLLFAMSIQILPVNVIGLVLVVLAVGLFILEIKFTSYGLLTLGGVVALTIGFITLFDTSEVPSLRLPLSFILPTAVTIGLVMGGVTFMVILAHRARVVTGVEGLMGEVGEAITDIGASGKVFVHGEYWNATSAEPIASGAKVRVKTVNQLGLEVERADS